MQLWIFVKQIVTFDWGQQLGDQRGGGAPVRHAPAGDADGDDARSCVLDTLLAMPFAMWRRLRARLAHRPGDHGDHARWRCRSRFLVYIIVGQYLFGFQLGWFPVQGWSDSVLDQPRHLRAAAGAAGGDGGPGAADAAVPHASSSTRSATTTCAPRAPRA